MMEFTPFATFKICSALINRKPKLCLFLSDMKLEQTRNDAITTACLLVNLQ